MGLRDRPAGGGNDLWRAGSARGRVRGPRESGIPVRLGLRELPRGEFDLAVSLNQQRSKQRGAGEVNVLRETAS